MNRATVVSVSLWSIAALRRDLTTILETEDRGFKTVGDIIYRCLYLSTAKLNLIGISLQYC
jgi:hypothetical protein